jgi:hypothetical protein
VRYRPINQPGTVDAMQAPEGDTAEYRNFLSHARTPSAALAAKPGQWVVRDRCGNLSAFDNKFFRMLFEAVS